MTNGDEVSRAVDEACIEELERRGLRRAGAGRADREIAPGISGTVSIFADVRVDPASADYVASVTPVVGVRHEEASLLASRFLGVAHSQPALPLDNLIKDRFAPPEWVAENAAGIQAVSYRVTEAVVTYGFPFMERLRSAEAIIHELSLPRWRRRGAYILAILHMLGGDAHEAREALMRHSLPISQKPTVWGQGAGQFAAFLEAFQEYFKVDLRVTDWPTSQAQPKKEIAYNFRDRNVLRAGLEAVGRPDLVGRAARSDQGTLQRIGERGTALVRSGDAEDLTIAFGRAAEEILDRGNGAHGADQ